MADLALLLVGLGAGFFLGATFARLMWRKRYEQMRESYTRVLHAWAQETAQHGFFLLRLKGKDGPRA
jgi:alkanesulfonate monooxygenase SsuD/methylene tetrahydromethanopterin reductase-like flavin-dependent oxidoreductase (luciferase family)